MKLDRIYMAGGVIILAALVGGLLFFHSPAQPTEEHTWAPFTNSILGITLEYPSDILVPNQGADTATTSVNIVFKGATTPNAYAIRIGTQDTTAKDIAGYFASPDVQTPYPPTPITIGGLSAMELDGTAYADYSIYLVRDGKLYVIVINLPPTEAEHVKDSIQFIQNDQDALF